MQRLTGLKVPATANQPIRSIAVVPPLDPAIIGPVMRVAAKHFPVYGVPGIFNDPPSGVHGLNERIHALALSRT